MEPQNPNQNQNEDLSSLSYKTMPQGKSLNEIKFDLQRPSAPPAMPAMSAPTPVPLASKPSAAMPGMPAAPAPTAPTAAAPIPASVKPVSTLGGFDLPNHGAASASFSGASSGGTKPWLRYTIIGACVLIVLGVGYYAYTAFFASPKTDNTAVVVPASSVPGQTQASQIPSDWMQKYFSSATCTDQATCGDDADPDHDGLTNYQEYQNSTDPNNPDSDKDGIADGDEVNIFGYNPQNGDSSGKPQYPDDVEAKTKWNVKTQHPFTPDELTAISAAVQKNGFHNPTIATLGQDLIDFYTNYGNSASGTSSTTATNTSASSTTTGSASDALDRDTQRSDTIKQIGFALLDYKKANLKFPNVTKWDDMIAAIKPLIQSKAINTSDPKNVAPYVYTYTAVSAGADFKLGYFSETQNQAIIQTSKDITAAYTKDQANQRDTKRKADLESISNALELFTTDADATGNNPTYPAQATWKTDLAPKYIATIPVDPSTNKDYSYTVSANKDSYAIQAVLENPPTGKKGYVCGPDGCTYY